MDMDRHVWRCIDVQAAWKGFSMYYLQSGSHDIVIYLVGFIIVPPMDRIPSFAQLDSKLQHKDDP